MKISGFSLIEAIIAMAVLSLAIAIVFYGYVMVTNVFIEEMSDSDILLQANRPIEEMSKELRTSRQILSKSANSITFWYKDTNENGSREGGETISYTWYGTPEGNLYKTISNDAYIVATGIRQFLLTYNSSTAASYINVKIAVSKGNKVGTVESSIQCRNI